MRTFLLLAIVFALSSYEAAAQDNKSIISAIRKEFKTINSDSTYNTVVLDNEEFLGYATDGGSKLTGFYKAGKLQKMVSWIGFSTGVDITEFYFKNDKLIFAYEQVRSFVYDEQQQMLRLDSTEQTFEGRYYFSGNTLIDYSTTGHNRFENDPADPQRTLSLKAIKNRKLLTGRKK